MTVTPPSISKLRLSTSSSSSAHSLDLPSLQPLSHSHPLLSAPEFDVDAFLQSRVHIPLEELRSELRNYLEGLREELVKLINGDYEEFLSLGTGLRGEEDRLSRLSTPLEDVRMEVESVRNDLAEHQARMQEKLDERAALREEKNIARVAGEHTQIVYLLNKARNEGCSIVNIVEERIVRIKSRALQGLSTVLLSELQNQSASGLEQCLKTYQAIEGWEEAQEVVRKSIRQFCRDNTLALDLSLSSSPIAPKTPHPLHDPLSALRLPPTDTTPLASIYNRNLAHVAMYQSLIDIGEKVSNKFDFLAKVIWPEIGEAIMDNLGNVIFAAGRPDELHKNYTTTYRFLSLLESIAPSVRSVIAMRQSPTYLTFERRWQLPVYFQLRWKEIVGQLEPSLTGQPNYSGDKDAEWRLNQSGAVWKALEKCWNENVYIAELAPKFWRLNLQIIARYETYIKSTSESYVIQNGDVSQEDTVLRFLSAAVIDLNKLTARVEKLEVVQKLNLGDHLSPSTSHHTSRIIAILVRRCVDPLKLIRSIASQFRASHTSSSSNPIQPSYFVSSVLKPVHSLFKQQPALRELYGEELGAQVAHSVFTNYASTLASVKKTEDLLRKHRKSKKTGLSSFFGGGGGSGDSAAIKEGDVSGVKEEEMFTNQMKTDIAALRKDVEGLGVDVEGLESWKELQAVVDKPSEV
ncbi:uncharacterized protein L203_102700 [Cryptococcus depauperatus CBS 7841]|uniref:Conserved oligomeric Golgi complex subunit 2 n=1 Tax=Cryptococcus depauperatus CBS 7841 TaxID=1295531 RepID=A0AAJ8JS70_9TREE